MFDTLTPDEHDELRLMMLHGITFAATAIRAANRLGAYHAAEGILAVQADLCDLHLELCAS
jgi:hypothetical protein